MPCLKVIDKLNLVISLYAELWLSKQNQADKNMHVQIQAENQIQLYSTVIAIDDVISMGPPL